MSTKNAKHTHLTTASINNGIQFQLHGTNTQTCSVPKVRVMTFGPRDSQKVANLNGRTVVR